MFSFLFACVAIFVFVGAFLGPWIAGAAVLAFAVWAYLHMEWFA